MSATTAKRGGRVLLVDADPALRTIAQLHLAGAELLDAPDQATALALLRGTDVDVGVCALHGRVDCGSFLRTLRAERDPRLQRLPVLLVVHSSSSEIDALCARHGPAAVLRAPLTGPRLVAAVRSLVRAAGPEETDAAQ